MSELVMSFLLLPEAREGITNTSYAVAHFKLVFACGSMVLPHGCCSFSRAARENEQR
jgi:hypothetical protein